VTTVVDEAALSPQAIAAVEDVLRTFAKALRATKLYLPNNPTRAQAIERAREAFAGVWQHVNPLELEIREAALRWEGRVVYSDAERGTEGLPWLLYRDGLRSLAFQRGFETAELDTLFTLLNRARGASTDDDDLVTMLWVADLTALLYQHVESDGVVDLPSIGTDRKGVATSGPGQEPLAVPGAETPPPGEGPPPGIVRVEDFDSTLYFLDQREVTYLHEELKREYVEDPRRLALLVLFDIIESPTGADAQLEAVGVADQLLLEFLSVGDYELVALSLREASLIVRKGAIPTAVVAALSALPVRLSEPKVMAQLLQALDESARTPVASMLEGVFAELQPSALLPLVGWLGSAASSPARAAIERASLLLAGSNVSELARLLEHTDGAVVLGALRIASQLATPAAVPGLARLLRGDDASLRVEAVAALGEIGSTNALQAIERGIDDLHRDVRVATYRAITARKHIGALPRLALALRRKDIRAADLGEKMALFEAYGAICGDAGVDELDQLLNARGLLGAREPAEIRACAARALGLINSAAASVALRRGAETKDVVVRSAVARAMRGAA